MLLLSLHEPFSLRISLSVSAGFVGSSGNHCLTTTIGGEFELNQSFSACLTLFITLEVVHFFLFITVKPLLAKKTPSHQGEDVWQCCANIRFLNLT